MTFIFNVNKNIESIIDNNSWVFFESIPYLITLRDWLLFYDLKFNIDLTNLKWIKEINDKNIPIIIFILSFFIIFFYQ